MTHITIVRQIIRLIASNSPEAKPLEIMDILTDAIAACLVVMRDEHALPEKDIERSINSIAEVIKLKTNHTQFLKLNNIQN